MTLTELGAHARHLTDAVIGRNWLDVFNEVPNAQKAIAEFIAGWLNPGAHALSPEAAAAAVAQAKADLEALGATAAELDAACVSALAEVEASKDQIGASFDPGKVILFLELAKLIADMIRKLRERPELVTA